MYKKHKQQHKPGFITTKWNISFLMQMVECAERWLSILRAALVLRDVLQVGSFSNINQCD